MSAAQHFMNTRVQPDNTGTGGLTFLPQFGGPRKVHQGLQRHCWPDPPAVPWLGTGRLIKTGSGAPEGQFLAASEVYKSMVSDASKAPVEARVNYYAAG